MAKTAAEYKELILKEIGPIHGMPEIRELAIAVNNFVNLKLALYDYDLAKKHAEEARIANEAEMARLRRKMRRQEHRGILLGAIKVAVLGAVAVFAPPLLTGVIPLVGSVGTLSNAIATGVAMGAADAAVQEAAVKLDYQDSFSFNEVLECVVGGAVGGATVDLTLAKQTASVAVSAAATQAIEIAAGTREEFDIKDVGLQAAAVVVARGIKEVMPDLAKTFGDDAQGVAHTIANASMNAVLQSMVKGTSISVENLAANITGNVIGQKVGGALRPTEAVANEPLVDEVIEEEPEPQLDFDKMCLINEETYEQNKEINTLPMDPGDYTRAILDGNYSKANDIVHEQAANDYKKELFKDKPKEITPPSLPSMPPPAPTPAPDPRWEQCEALRERIKNGDFRIRHEDIIGAELSQKLNDFYESLPPFEKDILNALGGIAVGAALIAVAPPAAVAAVGEVATETFLNQMGIVGENYALRYMTNEAFSNALGRFTAVAGAAGTGKALSTLGIFKPAYVKEVAPVFVDHPLKGYTVQQVVDKVISIGVATKRNSLLLWSGLGEGRTGLAISQEFAMANDAMTLEMTKGGQWLDEMRLFENPGHFTEDEVSAIWRKVSEATIQRASGKIRAVIGEVRPGSIYLDEKVQIEIHPDAVLEEMKILPKLAMK